MSRHLRLIVFCAGLLASAGCSGERRLPTVPTSPVRPDRPDPRRPSPSDPQRLAALALFEAVIVHERLTTSPLTFATQDGKVVWTNGPCVTSSMDNQTEWFIAGLPRRRFAADFRNVPADRQPHLCGVFQQLSGGLFGRDITEWSRFGSLPCCRMEQPHRDGFGRFGARSGAELFQ